MNRPKDSFSSTVLEENKTNESLLTGHPKVYGQISSHISRDYPTTMEIDVEHPFNTAGSKMLLHQGKSHKLQERADSETRSNNSGSSEAKNFPETLKEILSDPSNHSAISWLPDGKSFLVLDRKKLVDNVLPKYLWKATKYTSFTRKLSRWNFNRISSGPDEGAWYNKSFFRDDKVGKVQEMKCAKRKKPLTKDFPHSKPLKKRPVDPSLFTVKDTTSSQVAPKAETVHVDQRPILGGRASAYTVGGRPLALADTRSVVRAAMRALLQSQLADMRGGAQFNGYHSSLNRSAREAKSRSVTLDALAALQSVQRIQKAAKGFSQSH